MNPLWSQRLDRRRFLGRAAQTFGAMAIPMTGSKSASAATGGRIESLELFLAGDAMTGRGIDQILPTPSKPGLFEPYVKEAGRYVELAEERNGVIRRPVTPDYIWGEALAELRRREPDARIINLETAITVSDDAWPGKGIHYRMHPSNVGCLTAAALDCCVLANNHVLDWGYGGLAETVATLGGVGIATAGAGDTLAQAARPAIHELPGGGRVLVFACGSQTSGISMEWAAAGNRPGVNLLPDLSAATVDRIADQMGPLKKPGDVLVVSVHWGPNWGYAIPKTHQRFARGLVDRAGVDVVHGHSSHHPLGIEVYRGRPILYGCGDFVNDYEGIGGHESFRGDLVLGYWLNMNPVTGRLQRLEMSPFQSRRFRLEPASTKDLDWLRSTLDRECQALGSGVVFTDEGILGLRW